MKCSKSNHTHVHPIRKKYIWYVIWRKQKNRTKVVRFIIASQIFRRTISRQFLLLSFSPNICKVYPKNNTGGSLCCPAQNSNSEGLFSKQLYVITNMDYMLHGIFLQNLTVLWGDGREIHTINFRVFFLFVAPQFLKKPGSIIPPTAFQTDRHCQMENSFRSHHWLNSNSGWSKVPCGVEEESLQQE